MLLLSPVPRQWLSVGAQSLLTVSEDQRDYFFSPAKSFDFTIIRYEGAVKCKKQKYFLNERVTVPKMRFT